MRFSSLAPFGLLAFSSKPSRARAIYDAMAAALGDNYDLSEGSYHGARVHAWACGLARVDATLARVGNQYDPAKAIDLLPSVEHEHGLAPGPNDTLTDRRTALSVRMRLPAGAAALNVTAALQETLGDDFVSLSLTTSPVLSPTDPTGYGNYPERWDERRVYRLTTPLIDAVPEWVGYEAVAPTIAPLVKGDFVTITPDNVDISERVEVQDVDGAYLRITHTRAHGSGAYVVLGGMANWASTQRHARVFVTESAALDLEKRRTIHDLMRRMARVVSTWEIVADGTAPFVLDSSPMDATAFAAP